MIKINQPLIIAISLFLTLLLGIGFLWPKYQDLKDIQQKIKNQQAELQSREEYFSGLISISEELKKYQDSLSKINSALPEDPLLPSLCDFLQKAASQSGLVLKGISPSLASPLKELSGIWETSLSLQLEGSYSSFKNFLSIIEKSARLIEVENISFSTEKETPTTFHLRIKVYSY